MLKQPVLNLSVLPIFFYFWTNPGHIPVEIIFELILRPLNEKACLFNYRLILLTLWDRQMKNRENRTVSFQHPPLKDVYFELNIKCVFSFFFRVFKKGSPNGKITVYLGKRDFVDHITHVDPIGKFLTKKVPNQKKFTNGFPTLQELKATDIF